MQHWFTQTIDPVAVNIFGVPIRWYGLSYIAGFLAGALILTMRARIDSPYPREFDAFDFLTYAAIGAVVGGRFGEIIFYNNRFYFEHPIEMLFIWKGGMASHGGMIGVLVATLVYARKHHIDPLILIDEVTLAALPGLFFGRIANFVNSEMVGYVTDVPWAVIFPTHDQLPRHPVQLYQAMSEGPLLAIILLATLRLNMRPGGRGSIFLISYGMVRCLTEVFREINPSYLGCWHGLTNGQLLSIGMIVSGIVCLAIFDLSKQFHNSAAKRR